MNSSERKRVEGILCRVAHAARQQALMEALSCLTSGPPGGAFGPADHKPMTSHFVVTYKNHRKTCCDWMNSARGWISAWRRELEHDYESLMADGKAHYEAFVHGFVDELMGANQVETTTAEELQPGDRIMVDGDARTVREVTYIPEGGDGVVIWFEGYPTGVRSAPHTQVDVLLDGRD